MTMNCVMCGSPIIVTDDNGSIGCSAECGWEGITLDLVTILCMPEKDFNKTVDELGKII